MSLEASADAVGELLSRGPGQIWLEAVRDCSSDRNRRQRGVRLPDLDCELLPMLVFFANLARGLMPTAASASAFAQHSFQRDRCFKKDTGSRNGLPERRRQDAETLVASSFGDVLKMRGRAVECGPRHTVRQTECVAGCATRSNFEGLVQTLPDIREPRSVESHFAERPPNPFDQLDQAIRPKVVFDPEHEC